jgi:hypothetical protein
VVFSVSDEFYIYRLSERLHTVSANPISRSGALLLKLLALT